MKKLLLIIIGFSTLNIAAYAQNLFEQPLHGVANWTPAPDWDQASLIGNGDMGAMILGNIINETITVNQHNLFLPINNPPSPIDQYSRLEEIRSLILNGNGTRAAQIPVEQSLKEGYPGQIWSDPYVPDLDIKLSCTPANIDKYLRKVDFENGVAYVEWSQNGARFSRSHFVSRADSLLVIRIKAFDSKISADFSLAQHSISWENRHVISENIKSTEIYSKDNFLIYDCRYVRQWKPNVIGYQGVATVKYTDGVCTYNNWGVHIDNASEVVFVLKVSPLFFGQDSKIPQTEQYISGLTQNYQQLADNHTKIHSQLFNRVKLNLNADKQEMNMYGDVLTRNAKIKPSKSYIQRQFEAARYNIISASGPNIPSLQGIWSSTWTPPWSGDYTFDGNVETAVSSYLCADLNEFMLDFFAYFKNNMPYYRENAKRLFGCNGIVVPSHGSSHGYNVHFDKIWCLSFWTGGAAWISQYFYDYYLYTGDINFLKNDAYPFMKATAEFYKDFLTLDKNGKYIFNPSYSPENNPANNPSQACINATMDVSLAKELLRNLIAAGSVLKENKSTIALWKNMLNKMPAYQVDKDGYFREWLWDDYQENHNHRHVSHLYGMYNIIDPEIAADSTLWNAVKKSYYERMKVRINDGGGVMVFGLCQMSWIAANIGDKEMVSTILNWLSAHYWTNSLFTYHDPNGLFNCDLSGGFQNSVIKALVYTMPGTLKLLPAKPDEWNVGSISGVRLRGNAVLSDLSWNDAKKTVSFSIKGDAQSITVSLPFNIVSFEGVAKISSKNSLTVKLKKDITSVITLKYN